MRHTKCTHLGCIFLPKGMNKGRLNPEPRGAGWHRRANCPPKHQGLAGRLRFFYALLVAFRGSTSCIMTKTHPSSSSLNSLGKRERPSNMHATSDYNMKTTIHEGRMWRWARSYDAPGMTPTPEMMRLKPRDLEGWLAGPAQPDPETRGAGWHPRAF